MYHETLKVILSEMSEYIYNGYNIPMELMQEMHEIYCSTCGSCGKLDCCPPNKCRFGLNYINHLNKQIEDLKSENLAIRKALSEYIKNAGWEPNENIINQEINFYGRN